MREAVDDLRRTADRGIDLDVDANRSAARTADDVGRMKVNADGLQSGIGPLRGFTDELGAAAGSGGMAANALIDAGEAAQIFGSQLGFSEGALGRLSLALGGIGLAAGGAIALFQYLKDQQQEIEEQVLTQLGVLDGIEDRFAQPSTGFEALADQLLGDETDRQQVLAYLLKLGLTLDDLPGVVRAVATADDGFFASLLTGKGVSPEAANEIARMAVEGKSLQAIIADPDVNTAFWQMDEGAQAAVRTVTSLTGQMRDMRIDESVIQSLGAILAEGGAAADELRRLREQFPDASYVDLFDMLAQSLADIKANASNVPPPFDQSDLDAVLGVAGGMQQVAANTDSAVASTERLIGTYDLLTGRISEERQLIALTEQYQRTLDALGEKTQAEASNSEDAAEASANYRKELLTLQQMVVGYGEAFDDIPPEKITRLYTAIDDGDLTRAATLLAELTADRSIRITVDLANPGPVQFLIDPSGGAPTQVSGARRPTVISSAPTVPTPPPAFSQADLDRVLGQRGDNRVTNIYTLGPDPVPAIREYEFAGGRAG